MRRSVHRAAAAAGQKGSPVRASERAGEAASIDLLGSRRNLIRLDDFAVALLIWEIGLDRQTDRGDDGGQDRFDHSSLAWLHLQNGEKTRIMEN